jgi:predicted MPP superfamily phosphohydrolase
MIKKIHLKNYFHFLIAFLLVSCATYKPQLKKGEEPINVTTQRTPTHTFFIAGGVGNLKDPSLDDETLKLLKSNLEDAPKESTMLFTGDYISPEKENWEKDSTLVKLELQLVENFKGHTYFIPGINEWKSKNAKKIEKVEDFFKDKDLKNIEVEPNNVCPLEFVTINDNLDLLLIDSDWLLNSWNGVKYINQKCGNLDTPARFSSELQGYISDAQDKNLIIAMHHPIFGNGEYAGKITLKDALLPIPGISTIVEGIGILGSFSSKMLDSRPYGYYRVLMAAMAQRSDRITFVSGHEENLQLLIAKNTPQIISGSLGTVQATRRSSSALTAIGGTLPFEGIYTHGARGFAKLEYFKDGSSEVTFITPETDEKDMRLPVLPKFSEYNESYKDSLGDQQTVQVGMFDNPADFKRSEFYKFLWGDRYRDYYTTPVTAQVVKLDTLYGGMKIIKQGGGQQSSSLRMVDPQNRQYNMRSLRKNSIQALAAQIPGITFEADSYKNTVPDDLLSDFFTTSSQYMQLPIYPLAIAAGVNHSRPRLFYVPKQEFLGSFNQNYGNQLYFIEERPSEEQKNFEGYNQADPKKQGKVGDFESTTDMLELIHKDEKYSVDQETYVRTRLFNMLLGDWDRHQDQFRWIEYTINDDDIRFIPVPRDRDNAFPKFGGVALPILQWFLPITRSWVSYGPEINSVKWFNNRGYSLDKALVTKYGTDKWIEQAKSIQNSLTEADIDKAFDQLPPELRQDSTFQFIKSSFRQRLKDLPKYAEEYGKYLNKTIVLHGTEKDDIFDIERLENGWTRVVIKRDKSDKKNTVIYDRTFNRDETREIWIYGLNEDDQFNVFGEGDGSIFVRLAGGYGKDHYNVTNKKGLKVYDLPYEESIYEAKKPHKQLTSFYTTNNYNWAYIDASANKFMPTAGYRLDDGVFIGGKDTYTINGFNGNPFRQQHALTAKYFFTFNAIELRYKGIYANIFPRWNFETEGYYTSDQFATNFFGYGNESVNSEETLGRNYFRARMEQLKLRAGITFYTLKVSALFENYRVNENPNRLFTADNLDPNVFDNQSYVGAETTAFYNIDDADDFPTESLYIGVTAGYKFNTTLADNNFGYVSANFEFSKKLIESGNLVFGTTLEAKTNFGADYFFYHAPSLGGDNGLRGFRDQRFTGDAYFYQSSDLRLRIKDYTTGILPITIGVFGGFDYGRTWLSGDPSSKWHTSQGGGLWISGVSSFGLSFGYFNSVETNIFQVGFGFGF